MSVKACRKKSTLRTKTSSIVQGIGNVSATLIYARLARSQSSTHLTTSFCPIIIAAAPRGPRGPRGTKIYVGNLNFDTTLEDVQAAFSEFGEVKDCFLPSDYDGNPRGFAFVTLDDDNALNAIEGLDGTELGGRTLNVKKSLPKESKPRDRY